MDGWRDPLQALQTYERLHALRPVTYTSRAPTATNATATNA